MTLIHLIAAFGICFGLQNDKALFLTKYIRKEGNFFDKMFDCSYCTGFHSGWIVWLLSAAAAPSAVRAHPAATLTLADPRVLFRDSSEQLVHGKGHG
jgi:hypothetical protein